MMCGAVAPFLLSADAAPACVVRQTSTSKRIKDATSTQATTLAKQLHKR
jgi:hypothetical protein